MLVRREIRYPLTHNLGALLELCSPSDPSLEAEIMPAVRLTEFSTLFRYPSEAEEPALEEAWEWLALARAVCESVGARIPDL